MLEIKIITVWLPSLGMPCPRGRCKAWAFPGAGFWPSGTPWAWVSRRRAASHSSSSVQSVASVSCCSERSQPRARSGSPPLICSLGQLKKRKQAERTVKSKSRRFTSGLPCHLSLTQSREKYVTMVNFIFCLLGYASTPHEVFDNWTFLLLKIT